MAEKLYLEKAEVIPYFQGALIQRSLTKPLLELLDQFPAVALLGSRQVGKTILAMGLNMGKPSHYLDLERPSDLA